MITSSFGERLSSKRICYKNFMRREDNKMSTFVHYLEKNDKKITSYFVCNSRNHHFIGSQSD